MLSGRPAGNDGFTLISTLLASVAMSTVVLGFSTAFQNTIKGQKSLQFNSDLQDVRNRIQKAISSSSDCQSALEDMGGNPAQFSETSGTKNLDRVVRAVDTPSGVQKIPVATVGESISAGQKVTKLWFDYQKDTDGNPVAAAPDTPVSGQTTHYAYLYMETERLNSFGGKVVQMAPIAMELVTDSISDEISACSVESVASGAEEGDTASEGDWVTYGPLAGSVCMLMHNDHKEEFTYCQVGGQLSLKTPQQVCVDAGFENYTGPCKLPSGVMSTIHAQPAGWPYSGYNLVSCGISGGVAGMEIYCE